MDTRLKDSKMTTCRSSIRQGQKTAYVKTFFYFLQNRLDDIINDWEETVGKGYCHCQYCKNESVSYPGECPEYMSKCNRERPFDFYGNETVREFCKNVECASCKAVSLLFDISIAVYREGLTYCVY